jgi:hypothetical protein
MQKLARYELCQSSVAGGCNKASRSSARASNTTTVVIYLNR